MLFAFGSNAAAEFSGSSKVGIETRKFINSSEQAGTELIDDSFALYFETDYAWQKYNVSLDFELFGHHENQDSERNRLDIRELLLSYYADGWELKAGIGQIFWGQTESQHRVDLINQTDQLGDIDSEDKLGQTIVNLTLVRDWGTFDLFALPSFRPRDFSADNGRFGFGTTVLDQAQFIDKPSLEWAARLFYSYNDLELAVSYFDGIDRDPTLIPQSDGQLLAAYSPLQQLSIDSLYVNGAFLWKLETIYQNNLSDDHIATTAGFEYTMAGIFNSSKDLGWIVEYSVNSSDDRTTDVAQNDLFIGTRWIFNDSASSEILVGFSQDLEDNDSRFLSIEGSTRLSDSIRVSLNAYLFNANDPSDPLFFFRNDDLIQLDLTYHF